MPENYLIKSKGLEEFLKSQKIDLSQRMNMAIIV
jgi:hypothetical protein